MRCSSNVIKIFCRKALFLSVFMLLFLMLSPCISLISAADLFPAESSSSPAAEEQASDSSADKHSRPARTSEAKKRGWRRLSSWKIVYYTSSGKKATGFKKIGSHWYRFNSYGYLTTGWFKSGKYRYYARSSGTMGKTLGALAGGWAKVGRTYYLFSQTRKAGYYGRLQTGWVQCNKRVYYYTSAGKQVTGLSKVGTRWYYFSRIGNSTKKGALLTGFLLISRKWHCFHSKGKVGSTYGSAYINETVKIGKYYYTFDSKGIMIKKVRAVQTETETPSSETEKKPTTNAQFIEQIGKLARSDMKKTGILASVTVAQAILESNYGKSTLAVYANNLFGMKASSSTPADQIYRMRTIEYVNGSQVYVYANFRKYSSWSKSLLAHSSYLATSKNGKKLRYAGIVGEKDYKKALQIIQNGGYATNPSYASLLSRVIQSNNLTRFD